MGRGRPRRRVLVGALIQGALALGAARSTARAGTADMFGLGASSSARAGASTATADDAYSAYDNPAGLTQLERPEVAFDVIVGQSALRPFVGIVYDSDGDGQLVTERGQPDHGAVGTDYRVRADGSSSLFDTAGLQIAAALPLFGPLAVGVAGFIPAGGLAEVELADPYLPSYVMFRNRNRRLDLHPALSIEPYHDVHLGVGAEVMTRVETSMRVVVVADIDAFAARRSADGARAPDRSEVRAELKTSFDRLSARMAYRAAPSAGLLVNLGVFVDPSDPRHPALQRFGLGVAYRGAWAVPTRTDIVIQPNASLSFDDKQVLLSRLAASPIELHLEEPVAFFEPARMALGMKAGAGPVDLSADMTWSRWSKFRDLVVPNRTVSVEGLAGVDASLELGRPSTDPGLRNTWTLRTGVECDLGTYAFAGQALGAFVESVGIRARGGFAYVPSPVRDQTGATNLMDSDRRVLSVGLGVELGHFAGLIEGPTSVAVALQYHDLATRRFEKAPGTARDVNGDGLVDYPYGYPLEGHITSAGSLWALTFGVAVPLGGR